MREPDTRNSFCLYLWRTVHSPGTVYLADDVHSATAVYNELVEQGYIVKVIHMPTDTEYEMRDGTLIPVSQLAIIRLIDQQNNPPRTAEA